MGDELRVQALFVNYMVTNDDGVKVPTSAFRGDTIDASNIDDKELERLHNNGAFEGDKPPTNRSLQAAYADADRRAQVLRAASLDDVPDEPGVDPETGVPHAGAPEPEEGSLPAVPSEMTDEEIDSLSGTQLDEACEQAGIDTSSGGSLSSGAMSADEKRQALKDQSNA